MMNSTVTQRLEDSELLKRQFEVLTEFSPLSWQRAFKNQAEDVRGNHGTLRAGLIRERLKRLRDRTSRAGGIATAKSFAHLPGSVLDELNNHNQHGPTPMSINTLAATT
jgi:hypothetical protein